MSRHVTSCHSRHSRYVPCSRHRPDNYEGDDPFYCSGESFDLDAINDLVPLMHMLWPNVYADNTAYSFWKVCDQQRPRTYRWKTKSRGFESRDMPRFCVRKSPHFDDDL